MYTARPTFSLRKKWLVLNNHYCNKISEENLLLKKNGHVGQIVLRAFLLIFRKSVFCLAILAWIFVIQKLC